ncbi:conserved hypothetical protein [Acidothermus cellulolyticus 11B]|uniref:GPR1/FUN34/yaaH family protein n=1 Tax=Acidothermus cellulolyticus (strain ATCC 43068 / DSM 8971 / 11B) TaxID=351607 RepID=A0LS90_ACIC1|nr:GPR1/FUN34/YaaH family transporter [Acidothermus cellulolyticus]ABK52300.1 conserved hypothetical protein [Acidothermus cellulolyticus 11B]MCL6549890.1 GPR1/FUN34/YaaH family transporter [Acidothermus cellulolyticus]
MEASNARTAEPYPRAENPMTSSAQLVYPDDQTGWLARTRVTLSPMAAPSILGFFGLFVAAVMVGAWQAGWYGTDATPAVLWPLVMLFGGLAQLVAGFAALRARDAVAVALHGTWGAFWLAWGVLQILVATGVNSAIAIGSADTGLAFWFLAVGAVTLLTALAAIPYHLGFAAVAWTLTAAAGLSAAGFWAGDLNTTRAGGVLFVIAAAIAWLVAGAMVFEGATGRTVLPSGRLAKGASIPGRSAIQPLEFSAGEPGVRIGQ